jgi:nucleotide-binding universal stress UspA family protein
MTAFSRVLVGLDGSESDSEALALAQRLVDPDGVMILASVEAHRSFRLPHARPGQAAAEVLGAARAEVEGQVAVRCIERTAASAARGLTEIGEDERADVVVLGSRRAAPEGRVTPGRTALRLLQGGPCAVAVAPAGAGEHDRFRHVGVAYDGSPEAGAALVAAYAIAARDGAAVSLFFAVVVPGGYGGMAAQEVDNAAQQQRVQAQDQLDAAADEAPEGVNPRTVLLYGSPAQEIARACDGIVDLLFTGSRGYGPMQRALAGSVAEGLLLAATQPVVVTPRSGIGHSGPASAP